jgi:hypothetical protein
VLPEKQSTSNYLACQKYILVVSKLFELLLKLLHFKKEKCYLSTNVEHKKEPAIELCQ